MRAGSVTQGLTMDRRRANRRSSGHEDDPARAVAPLKQLGLPGATSIAFLVPTSDDQIAAVEALWRARGVPGLRLKPAATGGERLFSVLSVSLDGAGAARTGVDASQAPAPAQAVNEARRSGQVAI